MTPKQSTRFLLWAGAKAEAGHSLTEEEALMFTEARKISIMVAHKILRIKPEEYAYTPGKGFGEV